MFYEFNDSDISENFAISCQDNFSFPAHMHNSFEYITMLSGHANIKTNSNEYSLKAGEAVLIFPNQVHSFDMTEGKHILCIFANDMIASYYSKIDGKIPLCNKLTPPEYLTELFKTVKNSSGKYEKKGVLYLLCNEFDKKAKYTVSDHRGILHHIFEYVQKNFDKECSLSGISHKLGYDYSYISIYFKRTVGISFNNYVNAVRLNNVCKMLDTTSKSMIECALESGYRSLRTFNRNFKEQFEYSPSEYRKKSKS